jgi:hypothetical protein
MYTLGQEYIASASLVVVQENEEGKPRDVKASQPDLETFGRRDIAQVECEYLGRCGARFRDCIAECLSISTSVIALPARCVYRGILVIKKKKKKKKKKLPKHGWGLVVCYHKLLKNDDAVCAIRGRQMTNGVVGAEAVGIQKKAAQMESTSTSSALES